MKTGFIFISFLFALCLSQRTHAQNDSIQQIDEVRIHASFSPDYQVGYSITHLKDSLLKTSSSHLSQLLRNQANVYIKEQGRGMVASISLRGSGASHTGVFWNGIPMNSSLNGQTDFNTIFPSNFNSITIRKGGGSVLLGSGAIGGAINLENQFEFDHQTSGSISMGLASYKSLMGFVDIGHSTKKLSIKATISGYSSENNYPYLGTTLENENGEIRQHSFQLSSALKINKSHQLYFKSLYDNSDRNTSGSLYTTSNANLQYQTNKALVGWNFVKNSFKSELKTAYLQENYYYIFDKNLPNLFSENSSHKFFSNYSIDYKLSNRFSLFSGLSYETNTGKGTDIQNVTQQNVAFYTWLKHKLSNRFLYNVSFRKEWSDWYKIPIVFSIDSKMKWSESFESKFNFSTNYRTPTINDLFWIPDGNPDLVPESSWTSELGQELQHKNIKLGLTLFTSESSNLIQWRPVNGVNWKPVNIQKVSSSGLEFNFKVFKNFNQHRFTSEIHYSYTNTIDRYTQKKLLYTPNHLIHSNIDYQFKKWKMRYDLSYTDKAYTTTTNTEYVSAYYLSNLSITKSFKENKFSVTTAIHNIFNTAYQIVSSRPMPNRNYKITVFYKF